MTEEVGSGASGKQLADPLDAEASALRELVLRLDHLGYAEYCATFNPLSPRLESWRSHRDDAAARLQPLIDLFLLADRVPTSNVEETVGDLIAHLCRLNLLVLTSEGHLATRGLVLLPILGNWLFFEKPQPNPRVYFGDDSMALLLRVRPSLGGRCLDLCSGSGLQALHCSSFAKAVTAVEIDEEAARLARINVVMNGRQERVSVHCADLYESVRGEQFDTIVANPPLIPFPDETPYPFVGHGGSDGLRVTRRILRGLPDVLAPGGTAQIIGACLSDGETPAIKYELNELAHRISLDMLMTVVAHQSLSSSSLFFSGLVYTAAAGTRGEFWRITADYQRLLAAQAATHLCTYFLQAARGAGGLLVQDLSDMGMSSLWYV